MAVTLLQPTVGITLLDETASTATMQLNTAHGTPAAAGKAAANTLRSVVQPATTCRVVAGRFTLTASEQSPAAAAAGGRSWRAGVFIFTTAEPDQFVIISVPGLRSDLVMTSGPGAGVEIDTTIEAVSDFIAAFIAGPWCSPFGLAPTALLAAIYQVRPA